MFGWSIVRRGRYVSHLEPPRKIEVKKLAGSAKFSFQPFFYPPLFAQRAPSKNNTHLKYCTSLSHDGHQQRLRTQTSEQLRTSQNSQSTQVNGQRSPLSPTLHVIPQKTRPCPARVMETDTDTDAGSVSIKKKWTRTRTRARTRALR